jgi:hypothetical protein
MHTQFIADRREHCIGDALTCAYFCALTSMAKIHAGMNEDLLERKGAAARVRAVVGRVL